MGILSAKPLFNPQGDTDKNSRGMIGGNTTNLSNFNSMKYTWAGSWYRQAMSNSWIPEEVNLSVDLKDYKNLTAVGCTAYDKILSFLVFSGSIQIANLSCIAQYITVNEVNLRPTIQGLQEAVHNQSHGYMLDSTCSPVEWDEILYQWKEDEHLLHRGTFIRNLYNELQEKKDDVTLLRIIITDYILENTYFYNGFMLFYDLGRGGKMPGGVQEIRYISQDENTRLWSFRSMIAKLRREEPRLLTSKVVDTLKPMLERGVAQKIQQGCYVIGDDVPGLTREMVMDYTQYLENPHWSGLGFGALHGGYDEEPQSIKQMGQYSSASMTKADFFEAESTAYAKNAVIIDNLQIRGYNGAGIPAWEAMLDAVLDAGAGAGVDARYPII